MHVSRNYKPSTAYLEQITPNCQSWYWTEADEISSEISGNKIRGEQLSSKSSHQHSGSDYSYSTSVKEVTTQIISMLDGKQLFPYGVVVDAQFLSPAKYRFSYN